MGSDTASEQVEDEEMDAVEDEKWDEDWGEYEGDACVSLFCDTVLPSVNECCQHDSDKFGFDLRQYARQHTLGDYDVIKCINFIRSRVKAGADPLPLLVQGPSAFADDEFLQPILPDDALMFHDFGHDPDLGAAQAAEQPSLERRVRELESENETLLEMLRDLHVQALPEELRDEASDGDAAVGRAGPSAAPHEEVGPAAAANERDVDRQYFDSYSYFDIHREMLEDRTRTEAYSRALEDNPRLVRGATVLDVGCGTGILSMFAARGGARRVIAVDGSARIAGFAAANVARNRYDVASGGAVEVVTGKVEELAELPVAEKSVDVLVSEWMGYALLFESMLDSVLYARDRWLRPGGAMLPDRAVIYAAAADVSATGLDFWDDVYGFKMPDIREDVRSATLRQPLVAPVSRRALMSEGVAVKEFDLTTMSAADADFHADFELLATRCGECAGVVLWFDTPFSDRFCAEAPGNLSTSPYSTRTHWVQTVLVLERPPVLEEGDTLGGRLSYARNAAKHRSLDISIELRHRGTDGAEKGSCAQCYVMEVAGAGSEDKAA